MLTALLELLGNDSWIIRCCALEAITVLAEYGKPKFEFSDYWVRYLLKSTKIVAIWQVASAPRWRKQISLLVLLACFKMGMPSTYNGHVSIPLPPWLNLVDFYNIFDCARTNDQQIGSAPR